MVLPPKLTSTRSNLRWLEGHRTVNRGYNPNPFGISRSGVAEANGCSDLGSFDLSSGLPLWERSFTSHPPSRSACMHWTCALMFSLTRLAKNSGEALIVRLLPGSGFRSRLDLASACCHP